MTSPEKSSNQGQAEFSGAQRYRALGGDTLQTRTEHSRSLEDAEKYRALETLKDLGVLIPLSGLETYHGRAGHPDEEGSWEIDPHFKNGGDDSGNANVNRRPTLYAGREDVARDFAQARVQQKSHALEVGTPEFEAEVHAIELHDTDAVVFNHNFNRENLSQAQLSEYYAALEKLLLPLTEGSPLAFEDRGAWDRLAQFVQSLGARKIISDNDTEWLIAASGMNEETVLQIVGGINAQQLAKSNPGYLVNRLVGSAEDLSHGRVQVDGEWVGAPLNLEYVQKYLHEAHIVGVQQPVYSATLDRYLDIVSFFDLDETKTADMREREREQSWYSYGGLADKFEGMIGREAREANPLMSRLTDAHARPEQLMHDARKVPGYEEVFRGKAGVWEGFTLGEHTETVLRNFEETYADMIPVGLLAPMRLAIMTHDIGKNEAVARLDKFEQSKANTAQAVDFLQKLGVDARHQNVIISMIALGSDLAYLIDVKGVGGNAKKGMFQLAQGTMREFLGREPSQEEMRAFVVMCQVLQRCDGGAYTSMAVTRPEDGGSRYRNSPTFNRSFAQPADLGRRKVHLRNGAQEPARHQLAPSAVERVSRVRMRPRGAAAQSPRI